MALSSHAWRTAGNAVYPLSVPLKIRPLSKKKTKLSRRIHVFAACCGLASSGPRGVLAGLIRLKHSGFVEQARPLSRDF